MSTRGETVRGARSLLSRRVAARGLLVVKVAMVACPPSVLDDDLPGRLLGRAGQLEPEDPVGVAGLGPGGIQVLAEPDRAGEGAERAFPPVIALLGHARLRLALAPDRHRVAHDGDVEALPVDARAERLQRDAL